MTNRLIIVLVSSISVHMLFAEQPGALELIDGYKANQDKLQTSFCIKTTTVRHALLNKGAIKRDSTKTYDLCYDGQRVSVRSFFWGHINETPGMVNIPEDKACYHRRLYDGSSIIQYGRVHGEPGYVLINKNPEAQYCKHYLRGKLSRGSPGNAVLGYYFGSDERIDEIARNARHIKVRDRQGRVGESDCYIIDIVADTGRYTIWVDPKHGYNIVRATKKMSTGDLCYGDITPVRMQGRSEPSVIEAGIILKNVHCRKVDDAWVPEAADIEIYCKGDQLNTFVEKRHYKVTDIVLDPDHDALGSFVLDDIPDGATVRYTGNPNIEYLWKNGEVVPKSASGDLDKGAEREKRRDNPNKRPHFVAASATTKPTGDSRIQPEDAYDTGVR